MDITVPPDVGVTPGDVAIGELRIHAMIVGSDHEWLPSRLTASAPA